MTVLDDPAYYCEHGNTYSQCPRRCVRPATSRKHPATDGTTVHEDAEPDHVAAEHRASLDHLARNGDGDRHATATATAPEAPEIDPTWLPVDLGPVLAGTWSQPEPTVLAREDDQCLLYAGAVNGFHADSGVGKGWAACLAIAQQLRRGHRVVLVDLEDTAPSIVARLRLLGATDAEIADRLVYLRPQVGFGTFAVDELVEHASTARLVVVDSLGEAFGLDAIDENVDAEVGPWMRRVARRVAEAGPAVLLVDHATKAADNPLHPSGSKRKRAAITGASYLVIAVDSLVAGKGGRLRFTCAKDRHGTYARSEHVADLVMTATPGGMRVDLYAPSADQHPAELPVHPAELPVLLAARAAVKAAKDAGEPLTLRALVGLIPMKARKDVIYGGIDLAVSRGGLAETAGPHRARLFTYAKDLAP